MVRRTGAARAAARLYFDGAKREVERCACQSAGHVHGHSVTGQLAADIDIDEASGVKHGLEVIRNAVTQGKTNPYLIHEFLLAADPREHTLDPGYGFIFK
jgi:hypothetical protein